jgi:hypothetical protein
MMIDVEDDEKNIIQICEKGSMHRILMRSPFRRKYLED